MKPEQRPLIAAITAAAVNGRAYSTTFDYQRGENTSTRVQIMGRQVIAFDVDRGTHLLGGLPSIYDVDQDHRFRLEIVGSRAKGQDLVSDRGFTVRVEDALVLIFDDESGKHYNFAVI